MTPNRKWRRGIFLSGLLLGACASNTVLPVYKLYPGPSLPPEKIATVHTGLRVSGVRIDGLMFLVDDYDRVHVAPGIHKLEWSGEFSASSPIASGDTFIMQAETTLTLMAGETYILRAGPSAKVDQQDTLWIEVESSGEIVYQRDIFDR